MYSIYGYNTDMRNVRWMGSLVRGDVFPDKGNIAKNTLAGFTINGKAYINGGQSRDRNFVRETVNHELFHLKPIVGASETLAHVYGDWRRKRANCAPVERLRVINISGEPIPVQHILLFIPFFPISLSFDF